MDQPISLKIKYTIDDPIRVARFVKNQSFIYRHDAILTTVLVFLFFAFLVFALSNSLSEINVLGLIVFSIIPAIVVGVTVYLMHGPVGLWLAKRRVTKYFESSPMVNDEKTIEFSSDGIKSTGNLSSSFMKWEAITRAIESETDLMFYTGNEKFGWYIPKNAFDSDKDIISVKTLLRQNLSENARLL
jgi:hypothetical protein